MKSFKQILAESLGINENYGDLIQHGMSQSGDDDDLGFAHAIVDVPKRSDRVKLVNSFHGRAKRYIDADMDYEETESKRDFERGEKHIAAMKGIVSKAQGLAGHTNDADTRLGKLRHHIINHPSATEEDRKKFDEVDSLYDHHLGKIQHAITNSDHDALDSHIEEIKKLKF
jgi:hypothetical protein